MWKTWIAMAAWALLVSAPLSSQPRIKIERANGASRVAQTASGSASTYVGRTGLIRPAGVAVDAAGNIYVAGDRYTQVGNAGLGFYLLDSDVFLTKLDANFDEVYTISFGGDGSDTVNDIELGPSGDVYLAGQTTSTNFPVINAYQARFQGAADGFLVRLTPNGGFVFSTYLGGEGFDGATAVAVDASGSAYVTGSTSSQGFPVTEGAFQRTLKPADSFTVTSNAFVAKFLPDGRGLGFSTFLGGAKVLCSFGGSACIPAASYDAGAAIAVDSAGNVYVGGTTNSLDFPTTPGAFHTECACEFRSGDLFVTKLNPDGAALVFSTYIAASGLPFAASESMSGLTVDAAGNVFVTGRTGSPTFPTTEGALQTKMGEQSANQGRQAAFVLKLRADGGSLAYSTFLTGEGEESISGIRVDSAGAAYVSGRSDSANIPLTAGSFPSGSDYLIRLNAQGSAALYATRLPTGSADAGIALGPMGDVHLVGASGFVSRTRDFELPVVLGVANAAGLQVSAQIAPGELISIFGNGVGPDEPLGARLVDGLVSTSLGGVQVLINGMPSPLTYAGPTQINAVVSFGLSLGAATMEIIRDDQVTASIPLAVVNAAPGVFRNPNSDGVAAWAPLAAAVNEDGTINSFENPAKLGSAVVIYATGLGITEEPVADGQATFDPPPKPRLPIAVQYQNTPLTIDYAGQAPDLVAGVIQINFHAPAAPLSQPLYLSLFVGDTYSVPFSLYVGP